MVNKYNTFRSPLRENTKKIVTGMSKRTSVSYKPIASRKS
jgi:hypothetical protein